jgi:hypothetical protein
MSDRNLNQVPAGSKPSQPVVCSYDTGYEHSSEHYAAVRRMVEEADRDRDTVFGGDRDRGHAIDARLSANAFWGPW